MGAVAVESAEIDGLVAVVVSGEVDEASELAAIDGLAAIVVSRAIDEALESAAIDGLAAIVVSGASDDVASDVVSIDPSEAIDGVASVNTSAPGNSVDPGDLSKIAPSDPTNPSAERAGFARIVVSERFDESAFVAISEAIEVVEIV
jgi:hypothetical protein